MPELPEWLTAEPPDFTYSLDIYDELGGSIERFHVELTRAEYHELTRHVGVMRGLIPQTVDATLEHMPPDTILYPSAHVEKVEQAMKLLDDFLHG